MLQPLNAFVIYAREDIDIKQRLLLHLNPLKKAFNVTIWHDEDIQAGQEWEQKIQARLEETDLFIMLVSIDFMNSEFISQVEFKQAIDRHKTQKSIVIPIIIKPCQWDIDFSFDNYTFNLSELQVLPDEGRPIHYWRTPEEAYNNVAGGIRKVLTSIRNEQHRKEVEKAAAEESAERERQQRIEEQIIKEKKDQEKQQKETQEEMSWVQACSQNNRFYYENYLLSFPYGKYAQQAYHHILEFNIREQEAKILAEVQAEKNLWNEVDRKRTIPAYTKYLEAYPAGLHSSQARKNVINLKYLQNQEEVKKKELEAWRQAESKNTLAAYDIFLQIYPASKFAEKAKSNIDFLRTPRTR